MNHALKKAKLPKYSGDTLLLYTNLKRARGANFSKGKNLILIHGFTANSDYMNALAEDFHLSGYNVFIFNYNSYKGIVECAKTLSGLIHDMDKESQGEVLKNGFSFICHSMGGLVGRAFIQSDTNKGFVKSLVTLGTPHNGTLKDQKILEVLVDWSHHISKATSGFYLDSKSALELIGKDHKKAPLLMKLFNSRNRLRGVRILSISGGKPVLEVGENPILNWVAQRKIQKCFGGAKNDGLVAETSSNAKEALMLNNCEVSHFNDYQEYHEINHTYLTSNQTVSSKIRAWLSE